MSGSETLISWLSEVHALEQQLITVLKNQSSDARNYPHIQQRLNQHLQETMYHADMVEDCIERLGGSTSVAKTAAGRMSGLLAGVSAGMAEDELVKDCIADFSAEHLEIAFYKALIAGADVLGHSDVADVCRQILSDEERMAEWLDQNLPAVVQEHLAQRVTS